MSKRFRWLCAGSGTLVCCAVLFTEIGGKTASSEEPLALIESKARQEQFNVLANPALLRAVNDAAVVHLLDNDNRYLAALAISELKNRKNRTVEPRIEALFRATPVGTQEIRFDPHGYSPNIAVMVASTEYLSMARRLAFLPTLLARDEVWAGPQWFIGSFGALGPGWIAPAIAAASDERRRAAFSYILTWSTTIENLAELENVLRTERGAIWEGVARGCERLNSVRCWVAMDDSIPAQEHPERLMARMLQLRNSRISPEVLFAAGRDAITSIELDPHQENRAAALIKLYEMVELCQTRKIRLTGELRQALRDIDCRAITAALQNE